MARFVRSVGRHIQRNTGLRVGSLTNALFASHANLSEDENTVLLHGNLDVTIVEGRDLPNLDRGILCSREDVSDPFVSCTIGTHKIFVTSVKLNNLNPIWDEKFSLLVCHAVNDIVFDVWDQDMSEAEFMGSVVIGAKHLLKGEVSGWYNIISKKRKVAGQLKLSMKFMDVSSLPKQYQIEAYFPVRRNCSVNLYSCARNSPVPVQLSDGQKYQPGSCFKDIFRSILGAEKFIHIAGWSVWKDLRLIRDSDMEDMDVLEKNVASMTLGELLIMKAKSGVKVAVMVWALTYDLLGAHDLETVYYFQDTPVQCCRVARDIYQDQTSMLDTSKRWIANASYTHHQKTIIMDSSPVDDGRLIANMKTRQSMVKGNQRTIIAYVGGLDLTDGRYDTPEHPLFKTLLTDHKDDFYQNSALGIMKNTGPRQPWQDIHAKVTGRAAADVNANFKERWVRQNNGQLELLYSYGEVKEQDFDLEEEQGDWDVQVLRSITDDSAFLRRHHTLSTQKTTLVDISIMKGYVNAIRSADKFLYVENQYFLGSAYAWNSDNKVNCHHGIPAEIVTKVVSKILLGEEFVAYIVIPLHPEGNPHDEPTQEILAWQRKTMAMMYKRVGAALRQMASLRHPTDYLMFFCLIKKEKLEDIPKDLRTPIAGTNEDKLRKSRRFMIYVHSKLLIVDDSVAIIGTANINQRSLAGARDSEIAVSCLQPQHTLYANNGNLPQGDIAKFRMRLFEEHLGCQNAVLKEPHTQQCVKFIKDTCLNNWKIYFNGESSEGGGQLILYPMDISQKGRITAMPNCAHFPDTKAKIAGTISSFLPEKLTT